MVVFLEECLPALVLPPESELAAEPAARDDSDTAPAASPRKRINHAGRAKVGDLVRYTPFYPEHQADEVTGIIASITSSWLGNYVWTIRQVSEEGAERKTRRFSAGGTLMIIREAV